MYSNDSHQFNQQNTNGTDTPMSSDIPSCQQGLNSSQPHAHNTMIHPNPFFQSDQFPNHLTFNFHAIILSIQCVLHFLLNFSNNVNWIFLIPTADQPSKSSKKCKRKSKGPNTSQATQPTTLRRWTSEEDIALTKAWLYISVDADVGTNQKLGSLWSRILQVWRTNMGEYDPTRNNNALSCRWGTIQSSVNKFHGFYEQLERNSPPSGKNSDGMMREALRMYSDFNEGYFKFEHCWETLKNNPKWCTQQLTKQISSKKQKLVDNNNVENSVMEESTYQSGPTTETANSEGVPRPKGRKAAKERKKKTIDEQGVVDVLGRLQSTMEKQFQFIREELELKKEKDRKELELKERNQKLKEKAQKRKDQERILNKDLSTMQPALRESFEAIQAKFLKEWEHDAVSEDVV